MKKIKDNISVIIHIGIGIGTLASFLLDAPWNFLIGGVLIAPCGAYLVWDIIENRNKSK